MTALLQIWHAVEAVVMSADAFTLAAAVVIIIAAGFLTESLSSIVQVTLTALIAFVLAKFAIALSLDHAGSVQSHATAFWHGFVDLKMLVLAAHVLIFAVLIGVVNTVRSIFR